jgi:predicted nucleic acid-binding Zn ribbon protein
MVFLKKAADILKAVLSDQEAKQGEKWSTFFRGWTALAGDDIAAHTEVKDIKRGSVLVEVDHPGWLQMFQLKKATILKSIKKNYPELEIRNIRCFLSSGIDKEPSPVELKERSPSVDQNTKEYEEFKALLERLREMAGDEE